MKPSRLPDCKASSFQMESSERSDRPFFALRTRWTSKGSLLRFQTNLTGLPGEVFQSDFVGFQTEFSGFLNEVLWNNQIKWSGLSYEIPWFPKRSPLHFHTKFVVLLTGQRASSRRKALSGSSQDGLVWAFGRSPLGVRMKSSCLTDGVL